MRTPKLLGCENLLIQPVHRHFILIKNLQRQEVIMWWETHWKHLDFINSVRCQVCTEAPYDMSHIIYDQPLLYIHFTWKINTNDSI